MWQQQIYVNWNQKKTEYVCLLPELKQLIHFYDDVNIVNAIYSIKQCWCSFLSSVLGVDCLGSGGWVRSSCVVFWVLTVWQRQSNMSPAASRTARAGRRSLGRAPTPPPTPPTPAPRWASAVARRGGGSRKGENILSCGMWCNKANLAHNHQEAEAGGWYFSAMPLKPHCGGCSGHLLPLWLENLLMRPLSWQECSVLT